MKRIHICDGKCVICHKPNPELFIVSDKEWDKYIIPVLQGQVFCKDCYDWWKVGFPKGWRKLDLIDDAKCEWGCSEVFNVPKGMIGMLGKRKGDWWHCKIPVRPLMLTKKGEFRVQCEGCFLRLLSEKDRSIDTPSDVISWIKNGITK